MINFRSEADQQRKIAKTQRWLTCRYTIYACTFTEKRWTNMLKRFLTFTRSWWNFILKFDQSVWTIWVLQYVPTYRKFANLDKKFYLDQETMVKQLTCNKLLFLKGRWHKCTYTELFHKPKKKSSKKIEYKNTDERVTGTVAYHLLGLNLMCTCYPPEHCY